MGNTKRKYAVHRPVSALQVLEKTFAAKHLTKKIEAYAAFPHWEEIVGQEIASVSSPEKLINGKVLVIRVLDPAWLQELSISKNELLEKISAFGQGAHIEDIRFLSGNPKYFSKYSS